MRLPENGYVKTASMAAWVIGDSPAFLLTYALRLLRVIVLLSLWRIILSSRVTPLPLALGGVRTFSCSAKTSAISV